MRAGLFPIKPGSLAGLRAYYASLLAGTPSVGAHCRQAAGQLAQAGTAGQALKMSADLYAAARACPTVVVGFDSQELSLSVESVSHDLQSRGISPASFTPNLMLACPLNSRESVHIPDISVLERKSPVELLSGSGGRRVFSQRSLAAELIGETGVSPRCFPNRYVLGAIPNGLETRAGAVLFTPLGPDRVTEIGYGFIFEYNPNGRFSLTSINEARTLSACLTLSIAEKIAAENL